MGKQIEWINGHCVDCGCYWGESDDVAKASGCKCECHD